MSHLRISQDSQFSPLIPKAKADLIVAWSRWKPCGSSPSTAILPPRCNQLPADLPTAVTVGEAQIPPWTRSRKPFTNWPEKSCFVDATEIALSLGPRSSPISSWWERWPEPAFFPWPQEPTKKSSTKASRPPSGSESQGFRRGMELVK